MRLRFYEWFLLLFGLAAIDACIWVNANQLLYQAYQDWAFDQTLRGMEPSTGGFLAYQIDRLVGSKPVNRYEPKPQVTARREAAPLTVIGRLSIPRLHVAAMVREGADENTLSRAVGHIPGTALPGRKGNIALAGHRDSFFRPLRGIREGDVIAIETLKGTYRYRVESTKVVGPRDVTVLAASGGQTLTLVTCYPFYYVGDAPKRFVVQAALASPDPDAGIRPGS